MFGVAAEQTKLKVAQAGIPLPEFEAAVDTLDQLQRNGKFQIFLARENSIKFVGESDEFRVAFGKRLGSDLVEKKKAQDCLDELQIIFQVVVATSKPEIVARILEEHVYDEEFEGAKEDASHLSDLKKIIESKVALISTKLVSGAIRERSRRLATAVGSVLEDVDIEIISRRQSLSQGIEIETPFLRIRLRYSVGGEPKFFFPLPPWVAGPSKDFRSFELECDENDIDLLISRLVRAKDLLSKSIDVKLLPEREESK